MPLAIFIHPFTHSFVCSFVRSFIHARHSISSPTCRFPFLHTPLLFVYSASFVALCVPICRTVIIPLCPNAQPNLLMGLVCVSVYVSFSLSPSHSSSLILMRVLPVAWLYIPNCWQPLCLSALSLCRKHWPRTDRPPPSLRLIYSFNRSPALIFISQLHHQSVRAPFFSDFELSVSCSLFLVPVELSRISCRAAAPRSVGLFA